MMINHIKEDISLLPLAISRIKEDIRLWPFTVIFLTSWMMASVAITDLVSLSIDFKNVLILLVSSFTMAASYIEIKRQIRYPKGEVPPRRFLGMRK